VTGGRGGVGGAGGARSGRAGARPAAEASAPTAPPRAVARRRLAWIAVGYAAATAVLVAVNLATNGPTWWYFAAGGVAVAIVMQALRLRS
jgi:hypothetical protein